jgi:hypothetical protein
MHRSDDAGEDHHRVPDSDVSSRVGVGVALISPEGNDISSVEVPPLSGSDQDDLPGLAGKVFPRPGRVGDSGHAAAGWKLDAVHLHPRDGVREEPPNAGLSLGPGRQRAEREELTGGVGRGEQFLDGDLKRSGGSVEHGQSRVGLSGLEVGPGRPRHAGQLGDLLLGEPARFPELFQVACDPSPQVFVGHALRITTCQWIGRKGDKVAERGHGVG